MPLLGLPKISLSLKLNQQNQVKLVFIHTVWLNVVLTKLFKNELFLRDQYRDINNKWSCHGLCIVIPNCSIIISSFKSFVSTQPFQTSTYICLFVSKIFSTIKFSNGAGIAINNLFTVCIGDFDKINLIIMVWV